MREISVRTARGSPTPGWSVTRTCHLEKRLIDFNVCVALKPQPGMIIQKFSVKVGCGLWERRVGWWGPRSHWLLDHAPRWKSCFGRVQFLPALPLPSITICTTLRHREPQVDGSELWRQFPAFPSGHPMISRAEWNHGSLLLTCPLLNYLLLTSQWH